ncbi:MULTISPECIES: hypothetical protein [Xanthomonas translucens group]|uniref:hypothetical protein n=1 Tax=Xanthomonas translucens group TaxID=3390202 RepID=UPI001641A553|nr:hypothetical protein [Xanthomonas translucens]MCC8445424.1 hypothetical protein [Xanthomonas translucens pv. translucens]UKE62493.1 hypothetical protein KM539_02855 [Xanthomonas translucens pv. poae]UNU11275.1 hypothetical protein KBV71_19550 [Xanthomonas translucens pv. translucens]
MTGVLATALLCRGASAHADKGLEHKQLAGAQHLLDQVARLAAAAAAPAAVSDIPAGQL